MDRLGVRQDPVKVALGWAAARSQRRRLERLRMSAADAAFVSGSP